MADKGIIFSAPMVRALLEGRKAQTRRLLKRVPPADADHVHTWFAPPPVPAAGIPNEWAQSGLWAKRGGSTGYNRYCGPLPYRPGDRLYVREAFTVRGVYSDVVEVGYRAHQNASHTEFVEQWPVEFAKDAKGRAPRVTWPAYKPSIHMPRWASRLWLQVTDVRVQRVGEISEADAIAEGIEARGIGSLWGWIDYLEPNPHVTRHFADPRVSFRSLWDSLHAEPGETWADNPFVVAVSFSVHQGNIDR